MISSRVASDRRSGYDRIRTALQAGTELHPDLGRHLREQVRRGPYGDRDIALRILRQADQLHDLRAELATTWFADPNLPIHYSGALSCAFDRRSDLEPLIAELEVLPVPPSIDAPRADDLASPGFRVSQAFGSILNALMHDRSPLSDDTRSRLRALCARYATVQALEGLRRDIYAQLT